MVWMIRPETADPMKFPYGLLGGVAVELITPKLLETLPLGFRKFG